ncbi:winged helix DNA-binding domain-containing protein [Embleya sp. NPDC050493]|uniref:winged helix DNA-binding domain-containing protein n=1 Tax=Embleya sp. NPDC050493 TaxID=3363989 RepID=UPI00379C3759
MSRVDSEQVDREQVLAFRAACQHLTDADPAPDLWAAAAAAGAQNTPPGNGPLALLARSPGLTAAEVDRALAEDKSLLQAWTVRQSPYLFPTRDLPVFTRPMLPEDEESWRVAVQGFVPMLDGTRRSAVEVVELTRAAIEDALDGQVLTKRELGVALGKRMPDEFSGWFEPDTFSSFTAILARAVSLTGVFVIAPRAGREASFVRTDQWLGKKPPHRSAPAARKEFVRRYLRAYGPSTPEHLAEWAGTSQAVAAKAWQAAADELREVRYDGRTTWIHRDDHKALTTSPEVRGLRVLPAYDPWLHLRDRVTAVPDRKLHKQVWKHTGNPGVVLRDGELAALWRGQKKGKTLRLTVEAVRTLRKADREGIEKLAADIAPFRGCAKAETEFAD